MLFSATLDGEVGELAQAYTRDPSTFESRREVENEDGVIEHDFVAVTQGLKAGQTVVSTGVFKLRNGMTVTVNNDLAPKPELNPKPEDT